MFKDGTVSFLNAQRWRSILMSDDPKHPKDNSKTPPRKPQEDLHRPEATLDEAPAGSPNAEERSRLLD
jgi:hypothetical protein